MLKTAEGKWILFDVATGAQQEFWPIDASSLLEIGSHTAEPPEGVEVKLPPQPPQHVPAPQTASVQTFVGPDGEAPQTGATGPRRRTRS